MAHGKPDAGCSMPDTGQLQFKKQVSRYEGAKAVWFSRYAVLAGIQRPASSIFFFKR